jgi:IS30 family transposase
LVEQYLQKKYSPEQIAGRLRVKFPDDPEMWVSTETIYQSLYVQSRGALRRELPKFLRTGILAGRKGSARIASRTWSTSPSARPRPPTARFPGTGRVTVRHDVARVE